MPNVYAMLALIVGKSTSLYLIHRHFRALLLVLVILLGRHVGSHFNPRKKGGGV